MSGVSGVYKLTACVLIFLILLYLLTPPRTSISSYTALTSYTRGPNHSSLPLLQSPTPVLPFLPSHYLTHYANPCWYDEKDQFQCLPKVYLAGMPKCGSTDLFDKLTWYPSLVAMKSKENHYWTRLRLGKDTNHLIKTTKHPTPFNYYLGLMHDAAKHILVNESTVSIDGTQSLLWDIIDWEERYPGLTSPPFTNAHLIHDVTPQAAIIVILRNPVDRLYSDFLYFRQGRDANMFHEAVVKEVSRFNTCLERDTLRTCCYNKHNDPEIRLNLGLYYCYIYDWYPLFAVKVVTLEEYSKHPVTVLLRLYQWLNIAAPKVKDLERYVKSSKRQNTNPATQGMNKETRVLLEGFYRPYNKLLARLLDDTRFLFN